MIIKTSQENPRAQYNVTVSLVDGAGDVIDSRKSHNIVTNIGRKWLRNVVGASAYPAASVPTPINPSGGALSGSERVQYMALGVGGALQGAAPAGLTTTQVEVVTVTELEDPVKVLPVAITGTTDKWLKEVEPQSSGIYFPDDFTIKFVATFTETEISFPGQSSFSSVALGTSVPISEAGLYISGADTDVDPLTSPNTTRLIAYNIFSPIFKTPNFVLRVEWEFRF